MLKIRLQRVGRKHEPAFRLVLTDSQNSTKSGRFAEILGSYDPRKSTDLIKTDRVKYWLDKGVQLTGTVQNLFINHKIIDAKKINVLPKKTYTPPAVEAVAEAAPVVEETPAPVEVEPVVAAAEVVADAPVVEAAVETSVEEAAPEVEETPAAEPVEDKPVVE